MPEKSTLSSISQIVINAFDVDINIYTINLLRKLRETSFGIDFVAWAENNPTAFMMLLRAASATIQSLPKNDNLVIEKITDHLGHLPVDIWQTATGGRREPSQASLSDEEFRRKYEHAVAGLSKEELAEVAKLRRGRLKEWIYSRH